MKIIDSSVKILEGSNTYESLLKIVEQAGRTCYKSEDKICEGSAEKFISGILKRGHEAVIEHGTISVRFICDRGVSHEIVRHRVASYCQESTRYCNYSQAKFNNELTFIKPSYWETNSAQFFLWKDTMKDLERAYFAMLDFGAKPEEARSILPNSLKTEICMTANIREWRHFFKMRTSKAAHPDMRKLAIETLELFKKEYPIFFKDIEVEK